jgi:glycosyltransferase involved in cell wall biosynthesis
MSAKVLFIVTEDWYFWMHRSNLAKHLQKIGYQVFVATTRGSHYSEIVSSGFTFIELQIQRKSLNPIQRIQNLFSIRRVLQRVKPDIIHNISIQPIFLVNLATYLNPKAKIINSFTGLGYLFLGDSWKKRFLSTIFSIVLRFLFIHKNRIFTFENQDDKNLFQTKKILSQKKVFVLPGSGVDSKRFYFSETNLSTYNILLPARLLYDKGILEFVEAARILKIKYPHYSFWLAGRLDFDNPSSIPQSKVQEWEREGLVQWLGNVDDMPQLYKSASIVCLPSYREGLPMSLLEAASIGRPLVATDTPGCREIVRDGENGFLVPVYSIQPIADAIEKILENSELRIQMGKRSRELVESYFKQEIVFREIENIYNLLA